MSQLDTGLSNNYSTTRFAGRKSTEDLREVLFQMLYQDGVNVDDNNANVEGVQIPLMEEVRVQGEESVELLFSRGKQVVIGEILPALILSRKGFMGIRKEVPEVVRNVVVEQQLHAATRSFRSSPSSNFSR